MTKRKSKPVRRSKRDDAEINAGAVHAMREWARDGLGFNCTFVDNDMNVIVGLAQRAVLAGLASDFSKDMQQRFRGAAEKYRSDHETSLGFALNSAPSEPELLAAAKSALNVLEVYLPGMNICKSVIPKVRAAIAKAEALL